MAKSWSAWTLSLLLLATGCGEWGGDFPIDSALDAQAVNEIARETRAVFQELGIQPSAAEQDDAMRLFASTLAQAETRQAGAPPLPEAPPNRQGLLLQPVPQVNDSDLLVGDGEIFPELERLLTQASSRIQIDIYLLGGDTGMRIAQILSNKHRQGVAVELMLDPKLGLGGPTTVGIKRVVSFLQEQGVPFRLYPLHLFGKLPNFMQNRLQIDHNKVVVVDQAHMLVGGMNFDDLARVNFDLMIKISGPTAQTASAMLAAEWANGVDPTKTLSTLGQSLSYLSQTAPQQQSTKTVLLDLIAKARKSVHVGMYEFGDPDLAKALAQAHQRGLDVRVLLDPKGPMLAKYGVGFLPDGMPNLLPAKILVQAGVPVRWFVPFRENQEMHMKMMVIDGDTIAAGSTNWTPNAFRYFRETGAVVKGTAGIKAEAMWQSVWDQHSRAQAKLTMRQHLVARLVDLLNRRNLAFW